MDAIACATRTAGPIVDVGGAFMLDPATTAIGEAFGLDFGEFYGFGRGSVLGDVDADVVAASFVFFNPVVVRVIWEAARAKREPAAAVAAYADACDAWGRSHLAGAAGLEELAELLQRVIASASPIGAPVFAGWRAVPLSDDAPARVMRQLHVLRELRGGLHGVAGAGGGPDAAGCHGRRGFGDDRDVRVGRAVSRPGVPARAVRRGPRDHGASRRTGVRVPRRVRTGSPRRPARRGTRVERRLRLQRAARTSTNSRSGVSVTRKVPLNG